MVKLPTHMEPARVTTWQQEQLTDFHSGVHSSNHLVITLEQKKGCKYANLLLKVYVNLENRILEFKNKSWGKEGVKNRGEALSSSSKWVQSAWSFIPQDFQNQVLFIFLPIEREERTSNFVCIGTDEAWFPVHLSVSWPLAQWISSS